MDGATVVLLSGSSADMTYSDGCGVLRYVG